MTPPPAHPVLLAWAGLVMGPAALLANTQLGLTLPYAECGASLRPGPFLSGAAVLLSLLGAWLSWRASGLRRSGAGMPGFIGSLGALTGLIIAFALLLQSLATLVISACAR
ncbi:hypothetical protein J8J14_11500 [Roseomonas sp. SSH11]|uniref:Uncharacterized protein n=1 Tax=Pararoseomonas baculiformis TaxID=2820812 RepID=A0ABS4AFV7_9PROT|nr:hypothetical protein [Pararoseomonas baculiformis]MBP0445405.1 hypothetical protein [Pararoseomonas baculiformis]